MNKPIITSTTLLSRNKTRETDADDVYDQNGHFSIINLHPTEKSFPQSSTKFTNMDAMEYTSQHQQTLSHNHPIQYLRTPFPHTHIVK